MRQVLLAMLCVGSLAVGTAAAAPKPLPGIRSPTGNIRCFLTHGGPALLLCSVASSSYADALQARCMRPDGSGVDWHGFALPPVKSGELNCTGGVLYDNGNYRPHYVTVPYGRSWRRGAFTCASRRTGVTCTNATGHGIFVSRESYRLW